jgi:uncharacterized protein YaeQ
MALTSTIHLFVIDLSDHDRAVYESLELRVARHPSESSEYLITRVLAYCLEYQEGITFSKGLSDPDEPAVMVRGPAGDARVWIEIGSPDAARLHRASKAVPRVVVYTHKDPTQFVRNLAGERIHRLEALEVYAIDRTLVSELVARVDRRTNFALSVSDRELHISIGTDTLTGVARRVPVV